MPRLRTNDLKRFTIPVPPLNEQRRIVVRIEELTRRVEEARSLINEVKGESGDFNQALFEKSIKGKWKSELVRNVVADIESWNLRKEKREEVEYLEISGVDNSNGTITQTKKIDVSAAPSRAKRVIRQGDVVFGTTRPYLKNIAVVPSHLDEQVCSSGICVLRPLRNKIISDWLFIVCRSDHIINQVIKTQEKHAYPAISDGAILDSFIPLPSIVEQQNFCKSIMELSAHSELLRNLNHESETELMRLMPALLSKAFRGEL